MPFYGEKTDGAVFYARQGRMEVVAWTPPAPPGDGLCQALTGRTEDQLVRDILNGLYDPVGGKPASQNQQKRGAIL